MRVKDGENFLFKKCGCNSKPLCKVQCIVNNGAGGSGAKKE